MDIDDIEYKVANGQMTAMQVFTKMKELSLSSVIDCTVKVVDDATHGQFELIVCGNCECGPITNEVKYCPNCGVKIGACCR